MSARKGLFNTSAYGGPGWSGRESSHRDEIGTLWASCGIDSEWGPLRSVIVHRPGAELDVSLEDPDAVQMLAPVDLAKARDQHDAMVAAYQAENVAVHQVAPAVTPTPNQMFCADLVFLTPEGAIMARPASTVRAGEERQVARRLADIGVPIARTLRGTATFEGADAMWLDPGTVMVGKGLRTNAEAAGQIADALFDMDVHTLEVDLPFGTMHFMGLLRIVDKDLAVCWWRRTPFAAVRALEERGCEIVWLPEGDDMDLNRGFNFVTLGPRKVLMVAGYPAIQKTLEEAGIECVTVDCSELVKAAGAIGCLTGILEREMLG
jgi:arginine deiminase